MPTTRCPYCSGLVRPDAPWCTQCYADLSRPAPATVEVTAPEVDPLTVPAIALGLPASVPLAAVWPCTTCGTENALAEPACSACGTGFLADLRETGQVVVPVVGDLMGLSRGRRLGLALAVVLALLVLASLVGVLAS